MILLCGVALFIWAFKHLNLETHNKKEYVNDPTASSEQIILFEIINRILRAMPLKVMKGLLIIVSIGLILLSLFCFSLLL
ncbi:hypothetical protein ACQKMN_17795 [Ureibacillus composti]